MLDEVKSNKCFINTEENCLEYVNCWEKFVFNVNGSSLSEQLGGIETNCQKQSFHIAHNPGT